MGAKRAVQGRSKAYDELLFEWNRANNPDWVDPLKVINVGHEIWAVAFSANGEYLLSGGDEGVRLWRAEDGEQMATRNVRCLAVSEDGKWVAAGTWVGGVSVWDAETCERVFSHREDSRDINAVDFSPDSTRLVSGSDNQKAIIWDIATHKRVQTLDHERPVFAAKYSSQGDRIATGTIDFVRVWDNDGHLLETMKVGVTPYHNTGLLWSDNHIFVVFDSKIKQFEASTGSPVSEWSVPNSDEYSCIALPKHGKFIAHTTKRTITFWDTTTHSQFSHTEHTQDIRSIAISPDDWFLAIGGKEGKIVIRNLAHNTVRFVYCWITMYLNNFTGCQSSTREQAQDEPPLTSRGNDNEPPDPAPVGLGHLLTEYAVLTPLSRKNPLNPPKQSPTHMTKAMEVILTYVFVLLSKGVLTIP